MFDLTKLRTPEPWNSALALPPGPIQKKDLKTQFPEEPEEMSTELVPVKQVNQYSWSSYEKTTGRKIGSVYEKKSSRKIKVTPEKLKMKDSYNYQLDLTKK